jgi:hypothetical protein
MAPVGLTRDAAHRPVEGVVPQLPPGVTKPTNHIRRGSLGTKSLITTFSFDPLQDRAAPQRHR